MSTPLTGSIKVLDLVDLQTLRAQSATKVGGKQLSEFNIHPTDASSLFVAMLTMVLAAL